MNKINSQSFEKQKRAVTENMKNIENKILVLSGKGGVGKSTVAANMAVSLSRDDLRVGLMDIDIHGPSVPALLNMKGRVPDLDGEGNIVPLPYGKDLDVMSIEFMTRSRENAVVWRGPMKMNAINQLLGKVKWGERDFLIIDSPPGTGDEPLSICQLINDINGAIVITTPQDIALSDVRKSVSFCKKLEVPVLGIIENMAAFCCPSCGEEIELFGSGGGSELAEEMEVDFLGRIPYNRDIFSAGEDGVPFVEEHPKSRVSKEFNSLKEKVKRVV